MDGTHESARLSAAQLRDRAAIVAGSLSAAGVDRDEVALLIAAPPIEFLVGLMGCLWAGVIAAPVAFPRRVEHLETRVEPVRANAGATAIVAGPPQGDTERTVLELLGGGELPIVPTNATAASAIDPVGDRRIAYLQYTSGSTSEPRGVVVTHDNLIANLDVIHHLLDFEDDSILVSWCPLTHDMGLVMGALPAIAFGLTSVLMPPGEFVRRPMAWMRALSEWDGTHGYSPNFGYDLCVDRSTPQDRAALDLSKVRCLVNGAEQVRNLTRDRFVEAFAPAGLRPEAHRPAYGLAEATVLVSCATAENSNTVVWVESAGLEQNEVRFVDGGSPGARPLVGDGVVGPGYEVRIVDPVGREILGDGRVGELWLGGPSVSPGYWSRAEETQEVFGGLIPGEDGRAYLRTGDLAFIHDDQIIICGRAKDLIVIHGRNIHPHDVELTAELAHEAARIGGTAAFSIDDGGTEALVIVVEVDGQPEEAPIVEAIRSAVLREFELHVADVLLVKPREIPKTSSGKKQRSMTRRLWQEARSPSVPRGISSPG
ncbi:MAG TPA: fatty acyl-AMP ligase [Acidimicrobiales bacterium]|jgi:acyl-CoA synthetase (AMP-forming)/AMP-acid ligase II|nr:fatty acyl-AMP ligase [Acidimicrobiales bacterium]